MTRISQDGRTPNRAFRWTAWRLIRYTRALSGVPRMDEDSVIPKCLVNRFRSLRRQHAEIGGNFDVILQ